MAMMDDKAFLITHIRNSFITSDDTGMCELILDCDEAPGDRKHVTSTERRSKSWHDKNVESSAGGSLSDSGLESDAELAHSFDILPDMDFESHRRRSNTAQRLDKLKRDKHKQSQIKHVQWRSSSCPVEEICEHFEKKDLAGQTEKKRVRSSLTKQLDECAAVPDNPFMDYFKFDGKATSGLPTKKIQIFLTMASSEHRPFPLEVVTLATAKVHDLIGLICWQYTVEKIDPPLQPNIEAYTLHIAEDDGEVDMDFPALDNREPISKFGFSKLALVEREKGSWPSNKSVVVTINLPGRGFSKLPLETTSIMMGEIMEKVLKKRRLRQREGLKYRLERQHEPGTVIDLESPLSAMTTLDFCLVRQNSVRGDTMKEEVEVVKCELAESLSSHQYQTYIVDLQHKLWTKTQVQLAISGEKIEIDPVLGKALLFKQKAVTHDTDSIAFCSLLDEKHSDKAVFRLVYRSGHEFRHHDFESDLETAREIVQKIMNIVDMRACLTRKEYMAHKEKKLQRRHTLSL